MLAGSSLVVDEPILLDRAGSTVMPTEERERERVGGATDCEMRGRWLRETMRVREGAKR
jgi:hypothetical protein